MICFDKLKLITNVKYISNLNKIKFEETIKNGEIIYRKYKQMTPCYICIIVNYTNQELSIEFTGKVLLDDYVNLINMNNISECLDRINQLDICVLDVDNILQNAEVTKCDVTKDVTSNKLTEIISFIKQNITSYKKWIVKEYKDGISIENTVTTPRYKKRIILYQKIKELVCYYRFLDRYRSLVS